MLWLYAWQLGKVLKKTKCLVQLWLELAGENKANLVLGTFSPPSLSWLLELPNVVFKVS